jgi:hypothetical protein
MSTSTAFSQSSPQPGLPRVRLRDPAELLAATPHLLGFRPSESVLLIAHLGFDGRRLGRVLRGDLPPPELARRQAAFVASAFPRDGDFGVTVIVVSRRRDGPEHDDPARLPQAEFVATLKELLADSGTPVLQAFWAAEIRSGAPWACYAGDECGGVLSEVDYSELAATTASLGHVTYDSREAMAGVLVPPDEAVVARRSALLDEVYDEFGPPSDIPESINRGREVVRSALRQAGNGDLTLTDEQAVELAVALSVPRIRDACLALAVPSGSAGAMAAEKLWLALVRCLPAPERAEPAVLLGYSLYMRHESAFAGLALENALDAVPDHVLAKLLHQSILACVPPAKMSRLGKLEGMESLTDPD